MDTRSSVLTASASGLLTGLVCVAIGATAGGGLGALATGLGLVLLVAAGLVGLAARVQDRVARRAAMRRRTPHLALHGRRVF